MAQARQIEPLVIPLSYRYSLTNNATHIAAIWNASANDAVLLAGGNATNPNALLSVVCRYNGRTEIITTPGFSNASNISAGYTRGRVYKMCALNIVGVEALARGGWYVPNAFGQFNRSPLTLQQTSFPPAINDSLLGQAISTRDNVITFFSPGGTGAQQRPIINHAGTQVGTLNDGFTLTNSQQVWSTSGLNAVAHINLASSVMRTLSQQNSSNIWNISWNYAGAGNVAATELQTLDDPTFDTNFHNIANFFACGSEQNGFFCRINGASSFAGQGNNIIWLNASGTLWRQVQLIADDARAATVIAQNNVGLVIAGDDGHYYYKNTQSGGQNNGLDILASPPNTPKLLSLSVFRNLPPYGHFDVPLGVKD